VTTLDFTPTVVHLKGHAGDTISFRVIAPSAFVAGREWTAQVRAVHDASVVDASFIIVPPTVTDGPAYLTLSSVDTARLALMGSGSQSARITGTSEAPVLYSGVWDCQVTPPGGGDPVNTLAYGTVTIHGDVTRGTP
jgi:hypothetical protein